MCGIAGFNWPDPSLIKTMTDAIIHRGPDAEGKYCDDYVSLGHRRLSILDLSEKGMQPMRHDDNYIVFNGEIYNFIELKNELILKGHKFVSATDTEVILHAYEEWGESCVKRFNGMWAFCIYDKKKNILFLSRDRFGEKPLYYYSDNGLFIFASEIKAIRKYTVELKINTTALNYFFYQKYIGSNLTIFQSVYKLEPAHNLIYNLDLKSFTQYPYYQLEEEIKLVQNISQDDKNKLIENLIEDAVEKRLIADVPVGSFLSGGLDSSFISAIIARKVKHFKTFSIGFNEISFDEIPFSKIVSEFIHTEHQFEYSTIDEKLIAEIVSKMDEPFGDSSVVPVYMLSRMARKYITVSLSGDAGDEVFGGYDTYIAYKIAKYFPFFLRRTIHSILNLLPPSDKKVSFIFKVKRFLNNYDRDIIKRHLNWMATFPDAERKFLLGNIFSPSQIFIIQKSDSKKDLLSVQLNDIHNYMAEDILKKTDLASMLNSLEVRIPFLDYRLVPLVLSLPENYKIRKFTSKWLLKKIATPFLPARIVKRKKRGFTVPVSKWIKESILIKEYLTTDAAFSHGLLNQEYAVQLFKEHLGNKRDHARQLWLVFVFNYWWRKTVHESNG